MFWLEIHSDNNAIINNSIDKNLFSVSLLFTKTISKNPGKHSVTSFVPLPAKNKKQESEPDSLCSAKAG